MKKAKPRGLLVQTIIHDDAVATWIKENAEEHNLSIASWLRLLLSEEASSDRRKPLRARVDEHETRINALESRRRKAGA